MGTSDRGDRRAGRDRVPARLKPARDTGSADYFEWQGRQGRSGHGAPHAHVSPASLPPVRSADEIRVEEHHASTTIVEKIRAGLLRRLRGEE